MDILIIDDGLGFSRNSARPSPQRSLFSALAEESLRRHLALAGEISKMGENVLMIRALPEPMAEDAGSFEFRDEDGVSQLIIRVREGGAGSLLPLKGLWSFCSLISANAPGIAGLFKPDAVICASPLPLCVFAGTKIAELARCVLITELSCSPAGLLRGLRLCPALSPALLVLKRSVSAAFEKSAAVIGLYPEFFRESAGRNNALWMLAPAPKETDAPSKGAKLLRASLSVMGEGGSFTLCYCGPVQKGLSLDLLVRAAPGFGQRLSVVIIGDGACKTALRRLSRECGASNVTFCDGIPEEEVPFVLSAADAVFVPENAVLKGFASEQEGFFRSLLAGRPVLAAAEKNSDFFRRCGGALLVSPPDEGGAAAAIQSLLAMSEGERELLGARCKSFARLHLAAPSAKALLTTIDNLVKQKEI